MKKASMGIGRPSKRQAEIFQFITKFQQERDYSPTLSEIANYFDVSIPTIHEHISFLRKKKLLITKKGGRRSIQTLNSYNNNVLKIPLMGTIAAGGPIEAIRNPEPVEIPRSILTKAANHFALRVVGVSMIEEGIFDGDIVIVREQSTAENGDKVVAYLPDRDAVTLKKLYKEKNRIKLVPANRSMKPFYEKNVEVQGKVIGLLRKEF